MKNKSSLCLSEKTEVITRHIVILSLLFPLISKQVLLQQQGPNTWNQPDCHVFIYVPLFSAARVRYFFLIKHRLLIINFSTYSFT